MGIGSGTRPGEVFQPVTLDNMTGYMSHDFDLPGLWDDICSGIESREPFYALKDWRKVFRIPLPQGNVVFMKVVDERKHEKRSPLSWLFSTEASRYFSAYRLFRRHGISTPELLFTLGERQGLVWIRSILCTRELRNHVALSQYFSQNGTDKPFLKEMILHDTARMAAKLHSLGFYFSMDGRNIFVRKPYLEGEANISLIDLDHVKRSLFRRMPERRRKRNLARFRSTLRDAPGMTEEDYGMFISLYNRYFYEHRDR